MLLLEKRFIHTHTHVLPVPDDEKSIQNSCMKRPMELRFGGKRLSDADLTDTLYTAAK